jgi:hypothetical protein
MLLRKITNPLLVGRSGAALTLANSLVNCGAVGFSTSLNVFFMRGSEKKKGISVLDPTTGETLGTSKVAAGMAINKTITTRWLYLIPIFFTSPVLEGLLRSMKLMPKRNPMKTLVDISMVTIGLTLAMPVCCGIYPQISSVQVCDLEEEIQASIKSRNLTYLHYNKGL